jgi:uncharacterized protein YggE
MEKIISIKGMGKVSVKPDYVKLEINLRTAHNDYEATTKEMVERLHQLRDAFEAIGFKRDDLKTSSFDIGADYKDRHDGLGNYQRHFIGYHCMQELIVGFDYSMEEIDTVLKAIIKCLAAPDFTLQFTVKDKNALAKQLLESACKDAKEKALILTKASGTTLGDLINIDYNWSDINIYSHTEFNECLCEGTAMATEMVPEDIDYSDTAAFTWTLK